MEAAANVAILVWNVRAGDFNLILHATDKNTSNINQRNIGRFRRLVDELHLNDVYLHGRRYTWSNERNEPIMAQLDRVMVSIVWQTRYPLALLQALSSRASDHCPLLLATNAKFSPKRRFHFEPWWPKLPGYLDTISHA
uniref:Endonuclease/exonuclease/phosphatase domain-containing protein n=1 Tax=Setaria viridis TaxID=4556 RepID=A0A4V6D316_SETVI|nr:hypothetical protein SEVIR_8G112100v2 [Setaria viridis]